jgi:peptidoglycan/LPS O-acetylase OafA/YrhL
MQFASRFAASAPSLAPSAVEREVATTAFDAGLAVHHGRFAIADALRLLAIVAVVFNHLVLIAHPLFRGHAFEFIHVGRWGVAMFFVLSGYLLSTPYLRSIVNGAPWPSTRLFLIRRVLRIFPLYLVGLAFSVIVAFALGENPSVADIVKHALMLQDFSRLTVPTINPPMWTMPVDFEFYLTLPFLALGSAFLLRSRRDGRAKAVVALLAAGIVVSMLYRFSVVYFMSQRIQGAGQEVFVDNGLGMAAAFFVGIFLALRFHLQPRPTSSRFAQWAMLLAGIALFVVYARVDSPNALIVAVGPLIAASSAALLLYALPQFPGIVALAETRQIALGAAMAYAIYLFHFPIVKAVFAGFHLYGGNRDFFILTGASLAIVLPLAYVAHRFVERPFLLLKDRQR